MTGAWEAHGRQEAILEALIPLDREISVVAARGVDGVVAHFDPIENVHRHHILDISMAPARLSPETASAAVEVTRDVLEALAPRDLRPAVGLS